MPDSLGDSWPASSDVFQDVQVTPEEGYEFSAWARKNDHLGNRMKLTVQWYDNLHRVIGERSSDELTTDDSAFQWLHTYSLIAPPGAVFGRFALHITGYGGADHWDDVCLVPSMAVAASPGPGVAVPSLPGIVRGMLCLPQRSPEGLDPLGKAKPCRRHNPPGGVRPLLLDIGGRRVAKLHAGANDIRGLAPGVYFVHSDAVSTRVMIVK
jgi:hypothetical protein